MLAPKISKHKDEIIELCCTLTVEEGLKVTVTQSAKCALMTGMGGLIARPIGMAVGGSVASIGVAICSKDKFKSVAEILKEMPYDQQMKLKDSIQSVVNKVQLTECVKLAPLLLAHPSVKKLVLDELRLFLNNELQLKLMG